MDCDKGEIDQPKPDIPTRMLSPSKRKLSRKMVTLMAYFHEDGKYCPRMINEHCDEHVKDDMNDAEMSMDLNNVPGFPGVGGMGMGGMGGMGFGGTFPGMDTMAGMSGGDLGMGGMSEMNYPGMGADMGLGLVGDVGIGDLGDMSKLSMSGGLSGLPGMSGGLPMQGMSGGMPMQEMSGGMPMPGMGGGMLLQGMSGGMPMPSMPGMPGMPGDMTGGSWPYDTATQMQLSGMSPDATFGKL